MSTGEEPACLLDFWIKVLQEMEEAAAKGEPAPKHSQDIEMAYVMMDFLFASQDASTASLTWIFAFLRQHPEVLAKVPHPIVSCSIFFDMFASDDEQMREEHARVHPRRCRDR